eukprot:181131-Rhodomonas_salina.1
MISRSGDDQRHAEESSLVVKLDQNSQGARASVLAGQVYWSVHLPSNISAPGMPKERKTPCLPLCWTKRFSSSKEQMAARSWLLSGRACGGKPQSH